MATTVERPLEWMRFDPVKFGLLVDGESLETEGAFIRIIRHLWNRGPLPAAEVRRICRGAFDAVAAAMVDVDGVLTLELVEDARTHGQRRVAQRVEAGIASAKARNERSTKSNERSTDVLSMSMSSSTSTQGRKERAKVPEGFEAFWNAYPLKKAKANALAAWVKLKSEDAALCLPAILEQTKALHFRGKDGIDYIPHGATWINARRWEDEVTPYVPPVPTNGKPKEMTPQDARNEIARLREVHGIPPGGFIEGHLIPDDVRKLARQ